MLTAGFDLVDYRPHGTHLPVGDLDAAMCWGGLAASAHHSFAATYDEASTVKIEGKLVQFRNPALVRARDGASQLGALGVTRETLRPGDLVVITGNPDAI